MRSLILTACAAAAALAAPTAHSQKPVYKCTTNGKTEYSHAPCIGAVEIDATPTRGADKWSGRSQKGQDVRRTEFSEQMGRVVRPITGMDDAAWKTATSRQRLQPKDRQECYRLDPLLTQLTGETSTVTGEAKARADVKLFQLRKRFNDLNC